MRELVDIWDISLAWFEKLNIGKGLVDFKVPYTVTQRYRTTDANGKDVFDKERAFENIARNIIVTILASEEILRLVQFNAFPESERNHARNAVAIEISTKMLNGDVWERVNTSGWQTGNMGVQTQATTWPITRAKLGRDALDELALAGFDEYTLYSEDKVFKKDNNGMIQIVNVIDDVYNMDNMTEKDAVDYLRSLGYTVSK